MLSLGEIKHGIAGESSAGNDHAKFEIKESKQTLI